MDIILSQNEKQLKQWAFTEKNNGVVFNNNIVITDKRFIYQKESLTTNIQKSVNRCDVPVQNIKAINSFYGATPNLLWLILVIIGISLLLLGLPLFVTGEIGVGIFMLIVGVIMVIVGIIFYYYPEKSPMKTKKGLFIIQIQTATPMGSPNCIEIGGQGLFKGKQKNNVEKIEIPEKEAIEIIETLGALIF